MPQTRASTRCQTARRPLECYRDHVPRRYLLHLSRGSELPTPMIAPTSETNERRLSTTMSDRGEFAIGPGAAKRMRACAWPSIRPPTANRSEEHTSELQSLMRISYAVFCLKKKKETHNHQKTTIES